jgi:hypothetical protein
MRPENFVAESGNGTWPRPRRGPSGQTRDHLRVDGQSSSPYNGAPRHISPIESIVCGSRVKAAH